MSYKSQVSRLLSKSFKAGEISEEDVDNINSILSSSKPTSRLELSNQQSSHSSQQDMNFPNEQHSLITHDTMELDQPDEGSSFDVRRESGSGSPAQATYSFDLTAGLSDKEVTEKIILNHFKCWYLTIGSWSRSATDTTSLSTFWSPNSDLVTYFIWHESTACHIQFPLCWIKHAFFEADDGLNTTPRLDKTDGCIVFQLQCPPKFYVSQSVSSDFIECADFTQGQQASEILVPRLRGRSLFLRRQLFMLTSRHSYQTRNMHGNTTVPALPTPAGGINSIPQVTRDSLEYDRREELGQDPSAHAHLSDYIVPSQDIARIPESLADRFGMPEPAPRPTGQILIFTADDDELLARLRSEYNLTWVEIADFFPGRARTTLEHRYFKNLRSNQSSSLRQ